MVNHRKQHTRRKAAKQGVPDNTPGPNRISACTPYDFHGKNLTPYGGLLPVATMLEKLGFQALVEENVTVKRVTKSHELVPVRVGHRSGHLRGLLSLEPTPLHRAGPAVDGNPEGERTAPPQSTRGGSWRRCT